MPSLQMQPGQGPPGNFPPSHGWRGPPPGGPGGMPPPFGTFVTPLVAWSTAECPSKLRIFKCNLTRCP